MHSLNDARTCKVMDDLLFHLSAFAFKNEFCHSRLLCANLHALVNVTISMTGDGDRLLPELDGRRD